MLFTPLNNEHKQLKAKMVEFAGYEMPVMYSSVKEEYNAVRSACGIFDISHMAPILLSGENVKAMIDFITCRRLDRITQGQVLYNALVHDKGGVIDDITFYMLDDSTYMTIANAANKQKVLDYFSSVVNDTQKNFSQVNIRPYSDYILMAVQGPTAKDLVAKTAEQQGFAFDEIFYYEFSLLKKKQEVYNFTNGLPSIISRTGYTGEDGYEILLPMADGKSFWNNIIKQGALPCGLAARDTLRMEVFYPLYGHELSMEWTPLQGGIGWAVDLDKNFAGKDVMAKQKAEGHARIRGFILEEDGVPRQGFAILDAEGKQVGEVTSGSFSFTWNKGFGLAFLDKEHVAPKQELWVDIRGKRKKIKTYGLSPYKGSICKRPK